MKMMTLMADPFERCALIGWMDRDGVALLLRAS